MDSETRMWERLWVILAEDDWDQIVYVYHVDRSGKTVKPFLAKWALHSELLDSIRNEYYQAATLVNPKTSKKGGTRTTSAE